MNETVTTILKTTEFLAVLNRQIPGPLLIIWDSPQTHKSKVVRQYIERDEVDIQLAFLPAYAPNSIRWNTSGVI